MKPKKARMSLPVRLTLWCSAFAALFFLGLPFFILKPALRQPGSADLLRLLLWTFPLAFVAFTAGTYFIARRLLAPMRNIVGQAKRMTPGCLNERFSSNGSHEFGQLAAVFNEMLGSLENSFSELKRFTSDASHELRTPLTALRAVGEVGLQEAQDVNELRNVIGSMLEEAQRLNKLIDILLLLARKEDGGISLSRGSIVIEDVLADIRDSLKILADEKDQTIQVDCEPQLNAWGDRELLRLGLMNILQNAIRYSPEGKAIKINARTFKKAVRIEIVDEGPGIALEHQEKVFDRFYRIDKARSRSDGGYGLGLYIAKWAVNNMDGDIDLESDLSRGSTFLVTLPQEENANEPSPASSSGISRKVFADLSETTPMSTEAILDYLGVTIRGLSWSEADRRRKLFGRNEVSSKRPPSWHTVLWHAFKSPFNLLLLTLSVVSILTGDLKAAVIMNAMIGLSTLLRFSQEMRSLIHIEALRKMVRNQANVLRQGEPSAQDSNSKKRVCEVPLEDVVPGDIVQFSAGDMIPADVRLLESKDLFVVQSTLTGESTPVEKYDPEKMKRDFQQVALKEKDILQTPNLCFMGSSVVSGMGTAVVIATGDHTYLGFIASKLTNQRIRTAFDQGVSGFSWLLIKSTLMITPVIFLINGLVKNNWTEAFFFAMAAAVGLTPEMLPVIVNANLARAAVAMARKKCMVKRLHSVQNLGAMDILCVDKTGTLTQDKVCLVRHVDAAGTDSRRVLEHAYLNSYFQSGLKSVMDSSIIDRAKEFDLHEITESYEKMDEIPFDFKRRRTSVVLKQQSGAYTLFCKGAVEELLSVSTLVENNGRIEPLNDLRRIELGISADNFNKEGFRILGIAYKTIFSEKESFDAVDEVELIFSGFIAFLDPPKETAADALGLLRDQHVTVKIFTGDSPAVAAKICQEVNLPVEKRILMGQELDLLSDRELSDLAETKTVFAKLTPTHKARLVRLLKERKHTVGFLGDGTNDVLALQAADVGISVHNAVDVAKESADIILLEKSLRVLADGILEGRRSFGNITKYIQMATSSNFGNVLSLLAASAFLPFLPMLPIQILIQNLLYDISQISLPWDRMDTEFLKKPRQWDVNSIRRFMLCVGPVSSIFDIITFFVLWHVFGANTLASQSFFQTGWFVVGLLTQILIVHVIRTEKIPFVQSIAAMPVILLTALVAGIGLYLPFSPLASFLSLRTLPPGYFIFLFLLLPAYLFFVQVVKKLYISRFKNWL